MTASPPHPPIRFTNAVVAPILAMHESGASVLTRAMSLLGLELGQTYNSPEDSGSNRFWENEFFCTLNIRILRAMDRNFNGYGDYETLAEIPELALGINLNPEDEDFVGQYISHTFACPRWGWKDPRTVLLFPFWLNLLTSLGFRDIRPMLVIRHPAGCVQALLRGGELLQLANQMQRDPTELILAMWRAYNRLLLKILDETDCFISIHRWLIDADHARGELERGAHYLDMDDSGQLQEALDWMDPNASRPADPDRDAEFVDAESLALYWTLVSRAETQRRETLALA